MKRELRYAVLPSNPGSLERAPHDLHRVQVAGGVLSPTRNGRGPVSTSVVEEALRHSRPMQRPPHARGRWCAIGESCAAQKAEGKR